MDLMEISGFSGKRHPWEVARLRAIARILTDELSSQNNLSILDIGCGDGYFLANAGAFLKISEIVGIDINMSDDDMVRISRSIPGSLITNRYEDISGEKFSLITLLDVIEHIEDDRGFLAETCVNYLADSGYLLITAPAFTRLFGSHDEFLGHYRRYNSESLMRLLSDIPLRLINRGFMFTTLILPRWFIRRLQSEKPEISSWESGPVVSSIVEMALNIDNYANFKLNRLKIRPPGLSLWALCQKQP